MIKYVCAGILVLYVVGPAHAQSHDIGRLYDRIDRLEAENARLREEVMRQRQQYQQRSGYGRSYGYRDDTLNDASRSMQDLNRLKDSFDRLRR